MAEATRGVLRENGLGGLETLVVQPSGMIGPWDDGANHLVDLIDRARRHRMPGVVPGGDVVDVRDVAAAVVAAADGGAAERTYLLSGRWAEVREILGEVRALRGGRAPLVLPTALARGVLPAVRTLSRITASRPLFTSYALDTLSAPALFSHERAAVELGFSPRPLAESVRDTVEWLERR